VKIIFLGRSKIANYCLNVLKDFDVKIINPQSFNISDFNNVEIIFYSRNISKIDFYFLNKLKLVNKKVRFVFLDTELNFNRFIINTSLLIKKIEFFFLANHFVNIERYYIPIVLGDGMNWTNSLALMKKNNIPLKSNINGTVQFINIDRLIVDIIKLKKISCKSIFLKKLAEMHFVKLIIVRDSFLKKILFYLKFNILISFVLLIKNQFKKNKINIKSPTVSPISLVDFYKLIINE